MNNTKTIFISLFILYLCIIQIQCEEDPYKILGVNKRATQRQIKQAFKRLSIKYHPDKNKDPQAEQFYMKVIHAYETLKNPEKKANYDRFGDSNGPQNRVFNQGGFRQQGGRPYTIYTDRYGRVFRQYHDQYGGNSHQHGNFFKKEQQSWTNFFLADDLSTNFLIIIILLMTFQYAMGLLQNKEQQQNQQQRQQYQQQPEQRPQFQ